MIGAEPRYVRPGAVTNRVLNPVVAWLSRRGLGPAGAAVLEVRGRASGALRRTPVNPLRLDGSRYLVAPRGETEWVRNLRAAGGAALVTRRREEFTAVELSDDEKVPVIRGYLRAWAWEVGMFFEGLSARSSDDDIAAVAPGFPVFRIVGR